MALSSEINSYTDFAYTGDMQSVTIPSDGIYLLECWGPGGGLNGGTGGKASGYKQFHTGDVIYICVGQSGGGNNDHGNRYNGGRDGSTSTNPANWYGKHPGGGCTHMATVTGELATLSDNKDKVLIVAGGAGASATNAEYGGTGTGGNGGGESGASGVTDSSVKGGTQTTGYAFGYGQPCTSTGTDGTNKTAITGGGAGWYGGYGGIKNGGGGSSYIGGVPEFTFNGVKYSPSTTTGGGKSATSHGAAKITKVADLYIPVFFNGTHLQKIIFNGTAIEHLIFNGTKLY